ncbi:Rad52/Rad22 family DNA repair protein [Terrisporobacter hibernicus]|uniref:Single-stranded DNA-binding protein n=1 Tax=Terrisporobacter hibernicus TaxID=2813371 RepID=A0AAX2ZLJ4_9FIRM|nr:Rad52/Rad22 family DNA repair protein [Terrisporobacter hibernicus]UEL49185.1 hypothetical protein JW646_06995 [Terrisporobacter hibernicus]
MDIDKITKELQKPFKEDEIEWRVGATNKEKTMGLALPYVTNKAIQNRLDEVFGVFGWKNEFKQWKQNSQLCGISVWDDDKNEWITKYDGADDTNMEATKGGLSDSMKRASTQFGIGRYLYKLDPVWCPLKDGKYLEYTPPLPFWALPDNENNKGDKEIIQNKPVNLRGEVSDGFEKNDNELHVNSHIKSYDVHSNFKGDNKVKDNKLKENIERQSNLITDKQINLFNIRAKDKNRNKVYELLSNFGYDNVEGISKKDFNSILYYIDQLRAI